VEEKKADTKVRDDAVAIRDAIDVTRMLNTHSLRVIILMKLQ
jgi:hypothetical protein